MRASAQLRVVFPFTVGLILSHARALIVISIEYVMVIWLEVERQTFARATTSVFLELEVTGCVVTYVTKTGYCDER